jgi:hypothetical protein
MSDMNTRKDFDFEAVIMLPNPDAVAPATEILAAAGLSLSDTVVRGATALDKDALWSWLEDLIRPLGGEVAKLRLTTEGEWMPIELIEEQILFATMLTCSGKEATGARDICHDIVKVIMAWRRGKLLPRWETPHLGKFFELVRRGEDSLTSFPP